jgi:hypothetical protein
VSKSKANPQHYAPGYHAPVLLRQLSLRGHPHHYATLCGMVSNYSVALYHPLPYGRRTEPSKKNGRALEGKTHDRSTTARDGAVTSGQGERSSPSPSALCDRPRRRDAVPATAPPSPTLWKHAATGHRHASHCALYALVSTVPSSPHTGGRRTGDLYTTTLKAATGSVQDTP